jgi:hypothetical protein
VLAGDGGVGHQAGLRSLGEHRLRDLGAAEQIFQVGGGVFPPLRSVDVVPTVRSELINSRALLPPALPLLCGEPASLAVDPPPDLGGLGVGQA